MNTPIKPGTDNKFGGGHYREVNSQGNDFKGARRNVKVDANERFPATQASGHSWVKED